MLFNYYKSIKTSRDLDSPDKISIAVDNDISFNIGSPRDNVIDGEQFLEEDGSTDKDSEVAKEHTDEVKIKAEIAARRAKVVANNGRYVCPEESCKFRCEANEILKIHVRNKHIELWGTPVRKQKMTVRLEKTNIEEEELMKAMMYLNKSLEQEEIESRMTASSPVLNKKIRVEITEQKSEKKVTPLRIRFDAIKRGKKRKAEDGSPNEKIRSLKSDIDKVKQKKVKRLKLLQKGEQIKFKSYCIFMSR